MYIREIIGNKLRHVVHPKLNRDIISLGLVKSINVFDKKLEIKIWNNPKYKSYCKWIQDKVKENLAEYNRDFIINILCDDVTPKSLIQIPTSKKSSYKLAISGTKSIVGKTMAIVNLALSLAKLDLGVGLIDLDLYGPGISLCSRNLSISINNSTKILNFINSNVFWISMSSMIKDRSIETWRTPGIQSALDELRQIADEWNPTFIFYDLPPGTGDDKLFLFEYLDFDYALIMKTTHHDSIPGIVKEINRLQNVKIPILGFIEFLDVDNDNRKLSSTHKMSEKEETNFLNYPVLGQIPHYAYISKFRDGRLPTDDIEKIEFSISDVYDNIVNKMIINLRMH